MALYKHAAWGCLLVVQVDPETYTLEGIVQEPLPNTTNTVGTRWIEHREDWIDACRSNINVRRLIGPASLIKVTPNDHIQTQ